MDLNCWTHFQCSTDCDYTCISAGRPYGGIGCICRRIPSEYATKLLNVIVTILSGLQVIENGCVKLNIIGGYLPHYSESAQQPNLWGKPRNTARSFR